MPMRPSLLAWLFPAFRRFPASSGGGVLPVVGVTLPVLLGFAVLAVDAGRYFNLHTSVQWAADAIALAAAAELDRKPDAIVRANRAIDNLVANDQRFGDSAGRIARANITARFLTGLPASDATAIGAGFNTTNPIAARFVEIAVQPVPFKSYIAAAASIQGGPTQASGSAVAGFDSVACKVAPLFTCNPYEGTSTNIFDAGEGPKLPAPADGDQAEGRAVFPGQLRLPRARRRRRRGQHPAEPCASTGRTAATSSPASRPTPATSPRRRRP